MKALKDCELSENKSQAEINKIMVTASTTSKQELRIFISHL
jgi:hypothetical protein